MKPSLWGRQAGMTVVELLIVVVIVAVVSLIANNGYRSFRERSVLNRAARVVAADVALVRSHAIKRRGNVSLVADESTLSYVIRDATGTVLRARGFGDDADLRLTALDVMMPGDSLTFNSRGLMTAAFVQIDVGRRSETRRVQANAVGRSRIVLP